MLRPLSLSIILLAAIGIVSAPATLTAQAASAPNPVRGGQLFLQCRACHTVASGAAHTVGPNLAGVVGAKAAARPGYTYSPALTKSGLVWSQGALDAFIKRPTAAVPGTKMAYAGVADAKSRADLIAYLGTLKARK